MSEDIEDSKYIFVDVDDPRTVVKVYGSPALDDVADDIGRDFISHERYRESDSDVVTRDPYGAAKRHAVTMAAKYGCEWGDNY